MSQVTAVSPLLFPRFFNGVCQAVNAALNLEILNIYMRWLSVPASGPVG